MNFFKKTDEPIFEEDKEYLPYFIGDSSSLEQILEDTYGRPGNTEETWLDKERFIEIDGKHYKFSGNTVLGNIKYNRKTKKHSIDMSNSDIVKSHHFVAVNTEDYKIVRIGEMRLKRHDDLGWTDYYGIDPDRPGNPYMPDTLHVEKGRFSDFKGGTSGKYSKELGDWADEVVRNDPGRVYILDTKLEDIVVPYHLLMLFDNDVYLYP